MSHLLILLLVCGGAAYYLLREQSPVDSQEVVATLSGKGLDPNMVKNRKELIKFYERVIRDLENKSVSTVTTSKSDGDSPAKKPTSTSGSARTKEIAEYKSRIAKLKAEIGE